MDVAFSNATRAQVKQQHPGMANIEVTKILVQMWKDTALSTNWAAKASNSAGSNVVLQDHFPPVSHQKEITIRIPRLPILWRCIVSYPDLVCQLPKR